MNSLFYSEIIPYWQSVDHWNEVTIDAGASQSTLRDFSLPECANSFSYKNCSNNSSQCSNRFIYWRTNNDSIELFEVSLDVTLRNNTLRLRFQNTPILRGVSIHEYEDKVVLLVPTISAVHRINFPHPTTLEKSTFLGKGKDVLVPSIFHTTSQSTIRNQSSFSILKHVSLGIPLPHTACSWLDLSGNAVFTLANSSGSVLMIVMSSKNRLETNCIELMKTKSLFRLINGLVSSAMRSSRAEIALSIASYKTASDIYIFALFNDLQIRAWSYTKQECILVDSLTNYDTETHLTSLNFTFHQCHLQLSECLGDDELYLVAYVPSPQKKMFFVFQPSIGNDRCKLNITYILEQTSQDMIDFCIASKRLWTLWLSVDNLPSVLTCYLDGKSQPLWMPVSIQSSVPRASFSCSTASPQDFYLKEIFKIGQFSTTTILKALNIFSRVKNISTLSSTASIKVEDLQKAIINAVENEILLRAGDYETSTHRYLDVAAECWDQFFSFCVQYHGVGTKPIGISSDPVTGCVTVIKKNQYSLIVCCDPYEIFTNPILRSASLSNYITTSDSKLYYSLKALFTCMDLIRQNIDEKLLKGFEEKMLSSPSPVKYAADICKNLASDAGIELYRTFQTSLPSQQEVITCIEYLLEKIEISVHSKTEEDLDDKHRSCGNSSLGVGALCAGLANFARQRFEFCRDLLLFLTVVSDFEILDDEFEHTMAHSNFVPKTVLLLRCYYVVLWCTQCGCTTVSSTMQDGAFKQFCLLEMPEYTKSELTNISNRQTVAQLFFKGEGGVFVRQQLGNKTLAENEWENLFPLLVSAAASLLWPHEGNVLLAEFLFSHCQYIPLQEYSNLLLGWSNDNKQFLNFLVGCGNLVIGKTLSATKVFLDVSKEVKSETLLCSRILKAQYGEETSLISAFYMKVIELLEQFNLSDSVVEIATAAINEINNSNPHMPIFYSILFKHYLNLNHSEEAFATLLKNPDEDRRKDCLRQLVVKLCEAKQFQKIIDLSDIAFEEEIVDILESRARCSDLCFNESFYGILYSLNIQHRKFRKAAAVMYELAMRFSREIVSLKGLKKQANCYLAVINCLHLSEPEHAWIVKPANHETIDLEPKSSKRNLNGDKVAHLACPKKIEVLGLEQISQEFKLVEARLSYYQSYPCASNQVITPLTVEETISLLLNAGLFETAIDLSKTFSLTLEPVFQALAYKCLSSPVSSDIFEVEEMAKSHNSVYCSRNSELWNRLHQYLQLYEKSNSSILHHCVADKLLSYGCTLPAWLRLSYQKRNFSELLYLYLTHGYIFDAVTLLIKYVRAVLGDRKEDFDLKFSLQSNAPTVWLPHTYVDVLLDVGNDFQNDETLHEVYEELIKVLDEYNETVRRVTDYRLSNSVKN